MLEVHARSVFLMANPTHLNALPHGHVMSKSTEHVCLISGSVDIRLETQA